MKRQDDGYPNLQAVAATLCMSERTVRRRLEQHDASYSRLLDQVRHEDAVKLLSDTSRPIEVIGYDLGYTSSANFTNAFRKWTGLTPSAYRKHLLRRQN